MHEFFRHITFFWTCSQEQLMDFFRGRATDVGEDTDLLMVGFTAEPIPRETVQTAADAPQPNTVLLVPVLAENTSDEGRALLASWQVDGLDPLWPLGLPASFIQAAQSSARSSRQIRTSPARSSPRRYLRRCLRKLPLRVAR